MEQRLDSMHSLQYAKKSDSAVCVFRCAINHDQDLCDGNNVVIRNNKDTPGDLLKASGSFSVCLHAAHLFSMAQV